MIVRLVHIHSKMNSHFNNFDSTTAYFLLTKHKQHQVVHIFGCIQTTLSPKWLYELWNAINISFYFSVTICCLSPFIHNFCSHSNMNNEFVFANLHSAKNWKWYILLYWFYLHLYVQNDFCIRLRKFHFDRILHWMIAMWIISERSELVLFEIWQR